MDTESLLTYLSFFLVKQEDRQQALIHVDRIGGMDKLSYVSFLHMPRYLNWFLKKLIFIIYLYKYCQVFFWIGCFLDMIILLA